MSTEGRVKDHFDSDAARFDAIYDDAKGPLAQLASLSEQLRNLGYELSSKPDPFGRNGLHHVLARQRHPSP